MHMHACVYSRQHTSHPEQEQTAPEGCEEVAAGVGCAEAAGAAGMVASAEMVVSAGEAAGMVVLMV